MTLIEYLKTTTQAAFATEFKVTQAAVSQWLKKVPAERCPAIEKATGGLVTCEEMRPDVDWAYLRASGSTQHGPGPDVDGEAQECLTCGLRVVVADSDEAASGKQSHHKRAA